MQIVDLHIHSHYSRATSKDMNIDVLAKNAKIKGIDILGTGDFTHPMWLKELKQKLIFDNGIYYYDNTKFILSGEVSLIYTKDKKIRKIHYIILAPNFDVVEQINEYLGKKGRLDYDGRPNFGLDSIEFIENMMSISKDIEIIPAHVWTPWFSIFGSMSGFDSVEECFEDKTKYIHALETGMSSNPAMNWRLSKLDKFVLVSNSDSHSPYPWRLGREANVFNLKNIDYISIINAIRTRKNFLFTIEVEPSYGKYHFDGHRNCNFSCSPNDAKKLNNICPRCGQKLTIGVLHRVEELADREEGFVPENAVPFKSLLPLSELIAISLGLQPFSKKVWNLYNIFIEKFNSEFNILLNVEMNDLIKIDEKIADLIIKNREGKIKVIPGFDGVYGKPILEKVTGKQLGLNKFLK
ncbi:MAG: endonuclease Q family protein [Candidatus Aenigmatarchaeota archaeon]